MMATAKPDPTRCKGILWNGFTNSQCRNAAKRDGWCGVHHPDRGAAKRARWEREDAERTARFEREIAERERLQLYAARYTYIREIFSFAAGMSPDEYDASIDVARKGR